MKNCLFQNNVQFNSRFASDISVSVPISLQNISIVILQKGIKSSSIMCTEETAITDLNITQGPSYPMTIAVFNQFNQLVWDSNLQSHSRITLHCPPYTVPTVDSGAMTTKGVSMVTVACIDCRGYYTGDKLVHGVMSNTTNPGNYTCKERRSPDYDHHLLFVWCVSEVSGTCRDCPYGGNCTTAIAALPNY